MYLACILDVYSRKCIGWSLSRRIDAQLPLPALALAKPQVPAGLIHHSDRGRQHRSNVYVECLLDVGASKSHVKPWPANRECVREIASQKTIKGEEVYLHQ